MKRMLERRIVIWGAGAIQTDIEALFPQIKPDYYIMDQETDCVRISQEVLSKTYSYDKLKQEDKDKMFVIICVQDCVNAMNTLEQLGYEINVDYTGYQRILYDYSYSKFKERFTGKKIVVWGAGKTFSDYRKFLEDTSDGIEFLIDGTMGTTNDYFGYPLYEANEGLAKLSGQSIVVTSTYYQKILEQMDGYRPGENCLFVDTYRLLYEIEERFTTSYIFENRQQRKNKLLLVLAGYKETLWNEIFGRIKKYTPQDYDVCILSSGLYSERISSMCEENQWSYLSTKENKISVILNLGIHLHKNAEWITKMDEDIFLTRNALQVLENTCVLYEKNERYEVGFVTSLIPVNTYGYTRFLELYHMKEEYEKRFGKSKVTDGHHHTRIVNDSDVAKFLWGKPQSMGEYIDQINEIALQRPITYSVCPSRYSIGLIQFHKELWFDMGMFPDVGVTNMGADEECINFYCMMHGKVMLVAENTVTGHVGYKEQSGDMLNYYELNKGDR